MSDFVISARWHDKTVPCVWVANFTDEISFLEFSVTVPILSVKRIEFGVEI